MMIEDSETQKSETRKLDVKIETMESILEAVKLLLILKENSDQKFSIE